ncbi:MAG: exo-alpha-sialidase, partial [Crenarchaeota archaeon]|nr:exo-alpha-sialidase [Thermoproteota archaeon]
KHGEAEDTGRVIELWKACGDPRDPANWQYVQDVVSLSQLGWSLMEESNLVVLKDGTWVLFLAGGTTQFDIYRLTSTDQGVTWSTPQLLFSGHKYNKLYIDSDGAFYMTHAVTASPSSVVVSKSTDLGQTWTDIASVPLPAQLPIVKRVGNEWYALRTKRTASDNINYSDHVLELYKLSADFSSYTLIKTFATGIATAPQRPWRNGFFYVDGLEYNGELVIVGETMIVDYDPDDGFMDQTQRHLSVLTYPGYTLPSVTVTAALAPSEAGFPWWLLLLIAGAFILARRKRR